jgi:hypothetical protein
MKINVKLSALRAISQFSADQDIRYYLNTVRVEADKDRTILTATDGHCMGIHRTLRAENEVSDKVTILLPLDAVKMLKPAKNKLDAAVIETDDGVKGSISVIGGATIGWTAVDGKFPDVARVIPQSCSGEPAQINPAVLAKFAAANKLFGKTWAPKIWHNGTSCAAVTLQEPDFFGCLMPYRDPEGLTGYSAPAWTLETF